MRSHRITNYTIPKPHRKTPIGGKKEEWGFVYIEAAQSKTKDIYYNNNPHICFSGWIKSIRSRLYSSGLQMIKAFAKTTLKYAASTVAHTRCHIKSPFMVTAVLNHWHEKKHSSVVVRSVQDHKHMSQLKDVAAVGSSCLQWSARHMLVLLVMSSRLINVSQSRIPIYQAKLWSQNKSHLSDFLWLKNALQVSKVS